MSTNKINRYGNVMPTRTRKNPNQGRVYDVNYISPCITTGGSVPLVIKFIDGDSMNDEKIVCENRMDEGLRTFKDNAIGTIRTIDSGGDKRVIEKDSNVGYRIRKLTPRECWRLMGFSDEDFDKAVKAGVSNSQLYKQAGNSIVTNVLYYIFKELYEAMPYLFDNLKVSSYFSGIGAFEIALNRLFDEINGTPSTMPKFYGGREINTPIVYDDYNSNIRNDQNTIGTLRTNIGDSGLRTAYKIIENNIE